MIEIVLSLIASAAFMLVGTNFLNKNKGVGMLSIVFSVFMSVFAIVFAYELNASDYVKVTVSAFTVLVIFVAALISFSFIDLD